MALAGVGGSTGGSGLGRRRHTDDLVQFLLAGALARHVAGAGRCPVARAKYSINVSRNLKAILNNSFMSFLILQMTI